MQCVMAAASVRHIPLGPHVGEAAVAVAAVEQEAVPFWSYWHLAAASQGAPVKACCSSVMNSETVHMHLHLRLLAFGTRISWCTSGLQSELANMHGPVAFMLAPMQY